MASIRLESLTKRFGALAVADDVSLTIADGEFFTFLGPSGCGKSTLLHLVAGIEPPTAGRIWLGDRDVTDLPPQKRDVAMVFQSYALYPHLSVYENLAFPLRNRRVPRDAIDREVREIAGTLGLAAHLAHRPGQLSGGQRQRVALGRALIRKPVAFLMDEPLSNLDAALRLEMREEIRRIHQTHRITTVFVTHDQEEAMVLSDRIAVLRGGRVAQCDRPGEIYARPADIGVAQFVGTPPMNLLPGALLAAHPALSAHRETPAQLVLGLRPEDVDVFASARAGALEAEVAALEATGPQTFVIGRLRDARLKGRLARGERLSPGDRAHFAFAAEALHRFDAVSGRRLPDAGGSGARAPLQ